MGGNSQPGSDKYSLLIAAALRKMAIILSLYITVYVILAEFGLVSTSVMYSLPMAVVVVVSTVVSAIWIYYHHHKSLRTVRPYIVPFHLLAIIMTIFITGIWNPFSLFWSILIAATGMVFTRAKMFISLLIFLGIVIFDISTLPAINSLDVISRLVMVITIGVVAWFISSLQAVHDQQHSDLLREKSEHSSEQARLLTLVNNVNEAIVSINPTGVVQFYNSAALNLLDTNQALKGKRITTFLKLLDEEEKPVQLLKTLSSGPAHISRTDLSHQYRNDDKINLSISSSRIKADDDTNLGYILVLRDITKQKTLEDERDEFISVVSHELRTPVTIVEGSLSNAKFLMQRGAAPSVISEALSVSHEQTLYLAKMINDLSTLSRAERGVGGDPETIEVRQLLHDLYNDYRSKASDKGLRLDLDSHHADGSVFVSRLYLEEILQNFITNSIKYTQKGSITLSAKKTGNQITFSVADTGIGISKADQVKVFKKFYRSEDYRTRETSGTGLGLYVVDKLARKINTRIELESRLNHGSTFSFSLPVATEVDKKEDQAHN